MIKHVFCDLDGTLYEEKISDKDVRAVENLIENGVQFNIATGRVHSHSVKIIENLNFNGYLICENGSYIYDRNGKCIFKGVLTDEQIHKIIEIYKSFSYIDFNKEVIYFKYNSKIYMPVDGSDSGYFKNGYEVDDDLLSRATFEGKVGNIGVSSKNSELLYRMVEDFTKMLGNSCDVYISSEFTLNIVPKSVSKFDAIKYVCNLEKIKTDEIATIGDSQNDINMLKNVKMSFAMSKSIDVVKASAKFETPTVSDAINMIIDYNKTLKG